MEFPLTLFDLSDRPQIELRGGDRQMFLNNFCTNDIKSLQPGTGCEAFLTSIKGRILAHLIVSAAEESLWIDSVPGSAESIVSHLDKYLITEEAELVDRSGELGPLCLVGTEAHSWLQQQAGIGELALWGQQAATIEAIDVIVRRVGFTEQTGYELVVGHDQRDALSAAITSRDVAAGSRGLFKPLRIAAGFPQYGVDLTEENIAQEAARNEQAISFTKGCYLGQEPIARLDALGHTNKELRRLHLDGETVPACGANVLTLDGAEAGRVTSAALAAEGSGVVALAMLKSASTAAGTTLEVLIPDSDPVRAIVG